mmetsp:Transcript_124330/g.175384  ORF Transcript_124330/g.175384 Transcript_124330/m.175384 type:complete len:257 (+) Transcript_124330:26-796(+)
MFKLVLVACCVAYALATGCGETCNVDAQCTSGDCNQCIFGKCGTGCSEPCKMNDQCRDPNCPFCPASLGICGNSPLNHCGGPCTKNIECAQDPSNPCKLCQDGKCTAGCGQKCTSDKQCVGNCRKCTAGLCAHDDRKCGARCTVNDDCDQGGICSLCMVTGVCGAGCSYRCSQDSQCMDPDCPACNGTMVCARSHGKGKCGQKCLVNSDCTGSGGQRCAHCIYGKCGAACGNYCAKASDCVTPGCQKCTGNKCSYP